MVASLTLTVEILNSFYCSFLDFFSGVWYPVQTTRQATDCRNSELEIQKTETVYSDTMVTINYCKRSLYLTGINETPTIRHTRAYPVVLFVMENVSISQYKILFVLVII